MRVATFVRLSLALALIIGTLVAAAPQRAAAALAVEYRTSRMLGLSLFASTIAGTPNRPPALREAFTRSPHNTAETQALIAEFRELHRGLREGADFTRGPSDRPNGVALEQLSLWRALESADLDELQRATQAMMPLSRQNRYFAILATFEVVGWFNEQETPYAALAASMINEGLATAVGNGWAASSASGSLDDGEWYNDPMVDGYAKALYPMVVEYLDRGKVIDRDFVSRSVEVFRSTFPDGPYKVELLLREIVLCVRTHQRP